MRRENKKEKQTEERNTLGRDLTNHEKEHIKNSDTVKNEKKVIYCSFDYFNIWFNSFCAK